MKLLIKKFIGLKLVGIADYFRFPQYLNSWGGPFNGQPLRKSLFMAIVKRLEPKAIVETGTFRGTTTEVLADVGVPVFSIEGNERNYGYAAFRLRKRSNVKVLYGDSRVELRTLFKDGLATLATATVFFYLDAHWNRDLPLEEEIEIIFKACPSAIVMIDDFQVPWDSEYTYDDYGLGSALVYDYIAPVVARHELTVFYPSAAASSDGGLRRGCVVLVKQCHQAALLSESLLRGI